MKKSKLNLVKFNTTVLSAKNSPTCQKALKEEGLKGLKYNLVKSYIKKKTCILQLALNFSAMFKSKFVWKLQVSLIGEQ